ncbi:hypothetical protein EV715DRAFT_196889 [Schizophyllum commune]
MVVTITSSLSDIDRELSTPQLSPKPMRTFEYYVKNDVPPGVDITKPGVHKYKQAPPTYLLAYLMKPMMIYDSYKRSGQEEATVEATLDKYLAFVKQQIKLTWGNGVTKMKIKGEEWWMFYAVQSLRKEDIVGIDQAVRDGFRRVMAAPEDPMLIVYHHPRVRLTMPAVSFLC